MSQAGSTWARAAAWMGLALLLGGARNEAPKFDPLDQAAPKTDPDLLIHAPHTDLSAYRLDCEVFGFSKDFKQIGAVGSEVHRGPKGKHRGEAYLLVYAIGKPIPIHNVIAHVITHADLPNDPVPIDDARDLLWVIENEYLAMWPKRPKYKQPKGWMNVEVLTQPIPQGDGLCTPVVGFALELNGKRRLMPFMPLDMKVSCEFLKHTDDRVYWGKRDVVVSMVRFDFAPSETNERSARFVVGASWEMAKTVQVVIDESAPVSRATEQALRHTLGKLGTVQIRQVGPLPGEPDSGPVGVTEVAGQADQSELAIYLNRILHGYAVRRLDETEKADIVVHVGRYVEAPKTPAPKPDLPTPALDPLTANEAAHQAARLQADPRSPRTADANSPSGEPKPAAATPPEPIYIKDWKIP